MKPDLSLSRRAGLISSFEDSVLALYMGGRHPELFGIGQVQHLEPGAGPQRRTSTGYGLHVVLDGRVATPGGWYGPGNHISVIDPAEEAALSALEGPALVWTLDMGAPEWTRHADRRTKQALTSALIAAETAELSAALPEPLPCPSTLCDTGHPLVGRVAKRLLRPSRAATAEAILRFVQPMPYRFGPWQERASATLARGTGMCTTKANLQVALMRQCGLEAGFAEIAMPISQLGQLMPDAWRRMQRPVVRHYFAAVKLGGRWHAVDASNDDVPAQMMAAALPEIADAFELVVQEGRPFSPQIAAAGKDPFEITVLEDLTHVMGKSSRFAPRHFEAMNTLLDRARGVGRRHGAQEDPGAILSESKPA